MIESLGNTQLKRVARLLKKSSYRRSEGVFVAEGLKMFLEAPAERIEKVFVAESFFQDGGYKKRIGQFAFERVEDQVFGRVSDVISPQGIFCLVKQRNIEAAELLKQGASLIILEGVQDPGNLGTIIRTAEAAGVDGILADADTADVYGPKVIRSTMGALYRMPFGRTQKLHQDLVALKKKGFRVIASSLQQSRDFRETDYRGKTAILIGNEGKGLKAETIELADHSVRIPMCGQAESLNAGVAAAIIMYERFRQQEASVLGAKQTDTVR